MTGKELIKKFEDRYFDTMPDNRVWLDPVYCVGSAFDKEKILAMSEEEIDNLLYLAESMIGAFY